MRRLAAAAVRLLRRAPFEASVVALAAVYVALHLSPSSYALALEALGKDASPVVGTPRAIRSDEWAVATPLFQAAVNNDFRETNETSFYGETLRSFLGLPLENWGAVFKPLVWPFFIASPALAYSFFWAACAALMLIGWSLLLRAFGFTYIVAALTSLILYFTPFVQAWSGPGPQLALFPWIVLVLIRIRSLVWLALALALLISVWLISFLYIPGLPPLLFLALALCFAFAPSVFAWRRLAAASVGLFAGGAIAFAYFEPVLRAYRDSHYPAGRWVSGGGISLWQVASQLLPGTTTEIYSHLVAENICEAATVATWLAALALCVVDIGEVRRRYGVEPLLRRDVRRLGVLIGAWGLLTLWQLVPLPPLSYGLGLGLSPEERTLFASGTLLLVAAAYAIDRLPIVLSLWRITAFASVVAIAWLLASIALQPKNDLVFRDELFVLVPIAGLVVFASLARPAGRAAQAAVLLVVLVPTAVGWGLFNPVQKTDVIFRKPDTRITRQADALAASRPDGAIAVPTVPGAVLNGAGYRSVTHVIATPSPQVFRRFFPDLNERTFDRIFNRYAGISLTTRPEPFVARPDGIRVPISVMRRYAATSDPP
jgi:hypothetical protein